MVADVYSADNVRSNNDFKGNK